MLLNVRLRDGEFELTSTTASPDLSAAATGDERRVGLLVLCLLALGVGIMTGIGAVILRSLIGLIHNLMFNGVFRIAYDANILEGPSRWGNWVFLSPILGGLVVVYLVDRFAPEAKGHGVPEVMDAIFFLLYRRRAKAVALIHLQRPGPPVANRPTDRP